MSSEYVDLHRITFKKKNGDLRTMIFVKLDDFPKSFLYKNYFIPQAVKKGVAPKSLTEVQKSFKPMKSGMYRVWDMDKKGFRVINENTQVGEVAKVGTTTVKTLETIFLKIY